MEPDGRGRDVARVGDGRTDGGAIGRRRRGGTGVGWQGAELGKGVGEAVREASSSGCGCGSVSVLVVLVLGASTVRWDAAAVVVVVVEVAVAEAGGAPSRTPPAVIAIARAAVSSPAWNRGRPTGPPSPTVPCCTLSPSVSTGSIRREDRAWVNPPPG
ncbi:hypothetical protein C1N91_03670 [Curtobacterium sp. SGAir0471]|nr:hypothetical protein C1N91_03670 [Curtobacterium sp. SGAir0471]